MGVRLLALLLAVACAGTTALAEELCIYSKADGTVVQVRGRDEVPAELRTTARCVAPQKAAPQMAAPQDIELAGVTGRAQLSTGLGPIDLRWPRAVTEIFGKTPERAVADAAMAVSRALQSGDFPTVAQAMNQPWQVVFMDENLPTSQIPTALVSNCHPGWMTPPANIYIVAQRAAYSCGGAAVSRAEADVRLATILVHEMGHAIEYQLLKSQFGRNKMRAEGFASWFEQYAARYSSMLSEGQMQRMYQLLAQRSLALQPTGWFFQGSPEDYGRASMLFSAIVSRRGVAGLMDVYNEMERSQLEFFPAIERAVGWSEAKIHSELSRAVAR